MPQFFMSFLTLCLVFIMPAEIYCCTVFSFPQDSGVFVGRNLDWYRGDGILLTNYRGIRKTAMVAFETDQPGANWISKYGSLTFNQIAPDRPLSGINEAGLTVDGLILRESKYPRQDSRPAIAQAQWIQYQLDTKSTVQEVIESDGCLRILDPRGLFGVHYMVCDISGDCAAIEFLDGKMVYHTRQNLIAKVLTNHTYEDSISYLKGFKGFGGTWDLPYEPDSKGRFVRVAMKLQGETRNNLSEPVDYVFEILHSVMQGHATLWSIVYDLSGKRVYFETSNNRTIRFVDLSKIDFSCNQPMLAYDLFDNRSGDISNSFKPYSRAESRKRVMDVNSLYKFSPDNIETIVQYPESTQCEYK